MPCHLSPRCLQHPTATQRAFTRGHLCYNSIAAARTPDFHRGRERRSTQLSCVMRPLGYCMCDAHGVQCRTPGDATRGGKSVDANGVGQRKIWSLDRVFCISESCPNLQLRTHGQLVLRTSAAAGTLSVALLLTSRSPPLSQFFSQAVNLPIRLCLRIHVNCIPNRNLSASF
jgi:hypothetical protein